MGVNFKALGGLIEVKYTTGNDVDSMSDEELDILQEELERIQGEIDKIRPKEEKPKNPKDILNDQEIPYEVRMKYIIEAYRKDKEKMEKLVAYAKHLEGEVVRLKEILIENGYTDNAVLGDYEPSKELKELRELRKKVTQLETEKKKLKKIINGFNVTGLENIISTYPLKIYKAHSFKNIINSQKRYIEELQDILDKHDIPYALRLPASQLETDGVDEIVEDAGRFLKMHKETLEKILEKWEST